MKSRALLLAASLLADAAASARSAEKPDNEHWLIWGSVPAERRPNGHMLVMTGPGRAIVFDTGRHEDAALLRRHGLKANCLTGGAA